MALNFLIGIDSRVAANFRSGVNAPVGWNSPIGARCRIGAGAPSTAELQPGRELANFMRLHENDIADMNRQALSAWG